VAAERAVVRGLGGDCHSPIAVLAEIEGDNLSLQAAVGLRDGLPPVRRARASGPVSEWRNLVAAVCDRLGKMGL